MDKIDYQGRNDALVKAIVMAGDLVLCNLLFYLFCHFGGHTGQSLLQSCLLISAVYFGCTVRGGVILHRRTKVRKFQIISVVLRNMFYFTIVATVLLAWGGFARPTAGYYTVFLVAMFAAISCFRLLLRWVLKQYWKRIRHRNGVVLWAARRTTWHCTTSWRVTRRSATACADISIRSPTNTSPRNVPTSARRRT